MENKMERLLAKNNYIRMNQRVLRLDSFNRLLTPLIDFTPPLKNDNDKGLKTFPRK